MAEVFSISGGPRGGYIGQCPPGWRANGLGCGMSKASFFGAAKTVKSPAAVTLQTALVSLGNIVRDPVLMKLKIDGILGSDTVTAVNRAFTTHIGAGQAAAYWRSGNLTLRDITSNSVLATGLITAETVRRRVAGGETISKMAPTAKKPAPAPRVAATRTVPVKQYVPKVPPSSDKLTVGGLSFDKAKLIKYGLIGLGGVVAVSVAVYAMR